MRTRPFDHARRFAGVMAVVFGLTLAIVAAQSRLFAQEQKAQPAPTAAAAADPDQPHGGYVGSETCLTCHEGQDLHKTPHGNAKLPNSPAANKGCESCHGPGEGHVNDDAKGHILKFAKMPASKASETCLTCHSGSEHAMWEGSSHSLRGLGCTTCHSVHSFKSDHGQLVKANQLELCATCHKPEAMRQLKTSHMPVREGKMTCTTCHNPHGSTNVRQLRVGNYINESCFSCHADKRGPFLWEHAAGRESCVSCHDPHGSNNDRMLVSRQPMLCQRCHIGTRHPSTIYDGTALAQRSNRLITRSCTNCHQQIHGSNHPSGNAFAR